MTVSSLVQHFEFRGHRVAFVSAGNGPPMLLVHNAGNDHVIWSHQLNHFASSYTVYGVDLLGFGASDTPEITYDLPLFADLLAEMVSALGLSAVTLVGNCIGAAATLAFTAKNPGAVKRLILFHLATGAGLRQGPIGLTYRLRSHFPWPRYTFDKLAVFFNSFAFTRHRVQRFVYAVPPDPHDPIFAHVRRLGDDPRQFSARYSTMMHLPSFDVLDDLVRPAGFPPTLVLWGRQNRVLSIASGRAFAARFRADRFEEIDNAGHMAMNEAPADVNRRIDEFLATSGSQG